MGKDAGHPAGQQEQGGLAATAIVGAAAAHAIHKT
jgi:hypothetical protein